MIAVLKGSNKYVDLLKEKQTKKTDPNGYTALMYACTVRNFKAVSLLSKFE